MSKKIFKIVFEDDNCEKIIRGSVEFQDALVKVESEQGNIVYINRKRIIFMKEIGGGR